MDGPRPTFRVRAFVFFFYLSALRKGRENDGRRHAVTRGEPPRVRYRDDGRLLSKRAADAHADGRSPRRTRTGRVPPDTHTSTGGVPHAYIIINLRLETAAYVTVDRPDRYV